MIPRDIVIVQDTREKRPLPFPSTLSIWDRTSPPTSPVLKVVTLTVLQRTLPKADYCLLGAPHICLVERKADLSELWVNLTSPQRRSSFLDEMRVLRDSCQHPVLLLEGSPHSLRQNLPPSVSPDLCRDLLLDLLHPHRIELWMQPATTPNTRRSTAAWVAAKMISLVHAHPPSDTMPPTPPTVAALTQ